MTTTLTGASLSTPRLLSAKPPLLKPPTKLFLHLPCVGYGRGHRGRRLPVLVVSAQSSTTPPNISEKVAESIKKAEQACAEDVLSGECAAAWDEVEELSAAASHARDKVKSVAADPLEAFCKDNPDTEECRTYED